MNRTIGISIPTFERPEWTLRAFEQVLYDDRVKAVTIVDDCSSFESYNELHNAVGGMDKVLLHRNNKNLGCYFNKKMAIELSPAEYCVLLDSDNVINTKFIDRIYDYIWNPSNILAPDMGEPALNYKALSGCELTKENIAKFLDNGNTAMMLNTMNYFVNRGRYLLTFDDLVEPWTSDSIYFNYCWLKAGNRITVVDGLEYHHEIHSNSHYTQHNQKNPGFYEGVLSKLRALK